MISAIVALAASVWAASTAVPASQSAADWIKLYALAPYRETWTVTVEVRSLSKDLPQVMQRIEARGGVLAVPLVNSVASASAATQQLMYRIDEKGARRALKDLGKLGRVLPPLVRPVGERAPPEEIQRKIDELSRDKTEHGAELARMPAVSSLVEAVLGHLVAAQAVAEKTRAEILLHLAVEESKKKSS